MQSLRKTNERLQYIQRQTDGPTDKPTDKQGRLLWTPTGKPRVQNHITATARDWVEEIVTYILRGDFMK